MSRIEKICFVEYKNIVPTSTVEFPRNKDFADINIFIGKNGVGKSSILHAIYGCTNGAVVSDFWFDSAIDQSNKNDKPQYWYEYEHSNVYSGYNKNPQVRMRRIYRETKSPDYWESSRPTPQIGMSWSTSECLEATHKFKIGQKKAERWPKFEMKAKYIDFRHNLTAFDSAIYGRSTLGHHRDNDEAKIRIAKYSKYISEGKPYRNSRKNLHKINLNQEQIKEITKILGKNYTSIQIIYHNFYDVQYEKDVYKVTILINDNTKNYSDAYAGSGESAIIQLVYQIMELNEPTIIILDEPESSLHVEAQKRLVDFLIKFSKKEKHQVFISTHSPFIVENVDINVEAIFKCTPDEENQNKINIQNIDNKEQAFQEVGITRFNGVIYVEDKDTQIVFKTILRNMGLINNYDVIYLNGFSAFCEKVLESGNKFKFLCVGDGDKYKDYGLAYKDDIKSLEEELKRLSESTYKVHKQNKTHSEIITSYRNHINIFKKRVLYIPYKDIETFLLILINIPCDDNSKEKFRDHIYQEYGSHETGNHEAEIVRIINKNQDHPDYHKMENFINDLFVKLKEQVNLIISIYNYKVTN